VAEWQRCNWAKDGVSCCANHASVSFRSEGLAIPAFVIVGGTIWLLASMLVSAPDRAELAPWIDRADDTAAPRQPGAGK
jgi:hypothetical protein